MNRKYLIDDQLMNFTQIRKAVPHISPHTLRGRLKRGAKTMAELTAPPLCGRGSPWRILPACGKGM